MPNTFGKDILIQAEDIKRAAAFYVKELGFEITGETPDLISLLGPHINMFIDRGPALGPVLEVFVPNLERVKANLLRSGCVIVRDEPHVPRCYVRDPHGLIYNLAE